MNVQAIWSISFKSSNGECRGGVIALKNDRIRGGDGSYYYIGDYSASPDYINCGIRVTHYFGERCPVFGSHQEFTVEMHGPITSDTISLQGHFANKPDETFSAVLVRLERLP
jgi:hypothetical protein